LYGTLDFCWLLGIVSGVVFGIALLANLSGNLELANSAVQSDLLGWASVENSKATFAQLNAILAQATKTLAALNQRAADLKIDTILVDADKTLLGLANNTESFNKTFAGVTSNTDSVSKTLNGLTSNTEQINKTLEASRQLMDIAQQLMASTQKSAQGTSKEVTGSLKQMQRVLGETVLLMEDMRRSTLGRWFVAPRSPGISSELPKVPLQIPGWH
jgi:methyl-accepting chemotaxis protein